MDEFDVAGTHSLGRRIWALPFLTVLAPSERYNQKRGQRHKKLTDWTRQMILQLRRWLPSRPLVVVGDSSYAVLDLLHFCQFMVSPVTFITRLPPGCRPIPTGSGSFPWTVRASEAQG